MKNILIVDTVCSEKGIINKDVNAGLGTRTRIGNSWRANILEKIKKRGVVLPLLEFGYLSSILKKQGYEVQYERITSVDNVDAVCDQINKGFDILIFYPSIVSYDIDLKLATNLKEKFSNIKIGALGSFAMAMPEVLINSFDWVISSEIEAILQKYPIENLKGVIKEDLMIDNLDELPFPDWKIYKNHHFSYKPMLTKTPFFTMLGSRGCPMSCKYYCPYPAFQGAKWRKRSVENILEEMEKLRTDHNAKAILFRDACFSLSKQRTEDFGKKLLSKNLNLQWACETRLDSLDKNLLKLLYDSGLRSMNIGIESEDPDIRKINQRKGIDNSLQHELIRYCYQLGIKVNAFFILALKGDSMESIRKTIKYAKSLNLFAVQFTINTPLPGTPYYNDMKHQIINSDIKDLDNNNLVFQHENLSIEDVAKFKEEAFVSYYFRPKYFYEQLKWRTREIF